MHLSSVHIFSYTLELPVGTGERENSLHPLLSKWEKKKKKRIWKVKQRVYMDYGKNCYLEVWWGNILNTCSELYQYFHFLNLQVAQLIDKVVVWLFFTLPRFMSQKKSGQLLGVQFRKELYFVAEESVSCWCLQKSCYQGTNVLVEVGVYTVDETARVGGQRGEHLPNVQIRHQI